MIAIIDWGSSVGSVFRLKSRQVIQNWVDTAL